MSWVRGFGDLPAKEVQECNEEIEETKNEEKKLFVSDKSR